MTDSRLKKDPLSAIAFKKGEFYSLKEVIAAYMFSRTANQKHAEYYNAISWLSDKPECTQTKDNVVCVNYLGILHIAVMKHHTCREFRSVRKEILARVQSLIRNADFNISWDTISESGKATRGFIHGDKLREQLGLTKAQMFYKLAQSLKYVPIPPFKGWTEEAYKTLDKADVARLLTFSRSSLTTREWFYKVYEANETFPMTFLQSEAREQQEREMMKRIRSDPDEFKI